ncbi:MAG TPA: hypothetical protein VFE05_23320, partial [Longimicrobiaceae bacterium]|nr:hypothetical protein [Longimicrobiaceae bacterium]
MADDHALYLAGHTSLRKQLLRECEEMAEYALNTGRRVPGATLQVIQDAITANESGAPIASDELRKLGVAHDSLSKLVLPATPYCLVLMDDDSKQGGRLGFLGPVPLVRRIMVVAIVSLIAFVWLSTSKDVTPDYADKIGGALHGSGVALLLNELFYMSAAALGGSFTLLFQMNQYIVQRNYDPKYEASYWIKLVLGVIAGLFVVTLVPLSAENSFAAPTLAMLGGFSASAVYRILNRLVQTMESMVQGDAKEMLANREAAAKLRATDEIAQNRMKLAANLVTLQQQLTAGGDSEEVKARLDHILRSLVPESADDLPPPP